MILIDELHRCGSLGVPQGLTGGLQIGTRLPLPADFPSMLRFLFVLLGPIRTLIITPLVQAALPSTTLAQKSSKTASCLTS